MDQPLVTVVIPTFNRPNYLELALRSAISQSYRNLEILVRDNASDPSTGELLRSFQDERVRYLRHPENIGMTRNVVGGFRDAKGKYVTHLHDDDLWAPDFVQKMVAALEAHPDAILAFSDHYLMNEKGEILEESAENAVRFGRTELAAGIHKPFKRIALIRQSVPMAVAIMLRRKSIAWDDFPNLICGYDYWLMYLASRDSGACYYVPEKLTYYRIHTRSESTQFRVRVNRGFIEIYERMLQDERVAEFHDEFRKLLALHHTEAAIAFLRLGDRPAARKLLRGGTSHGFNIKTPFAYAGSYLPEFVTRRLPGKLRFPINENAHRG